MNASDSHNDLHRDFIAVLDDVELERDHDGYRYPSGDRVPEVREMDIVFINAKSTSASLAPPVSGDAASTSWWSGLSTAALESGVVIAESPDDDLGEILAALGDAPPELSIDIEPEFFHSTLSQWMGQGGRVKNEAPLWDYAFWKAELQSEGRVDDREVFSAQVFRGHSEAPETYRYALRYDGKSVAASEWLSERPDLLQSEDEFDTGADLSESALLTLMND